MKINYLWCLLMNVALLPLYALFFTLSLVCAVLPINPSRTCRRNFRERLGLSGLALYLETLKVYLNYGFYFVEGFVLWPLGACVQLNASRFSDFMGNVAKAYDLRERGKGVIVVGGHYSVIEHAGGCFHQALLQNQLGGLHVLAKPAPVPVLTKLLELFRHVRGLRVIWTLGQLQTFREIRRSLGQGNSIALVNDQKPTTGGAFFRFFGAWAAFPFMGIDFAAKQGTLAIACNVRRVGLPGLFRIEYALLPTSLRPRDTLLCKDIVPSFSFESAEIWPGHLPYESGKLREETAQQLAAYVGWLESLVKMGRSQWCWDYRKWSRQPPSEADLRRA